VLRPSHRHHDYAADDDDDDGDEVGTPSFFEHRPAIHHRPQHTLYGSTAEATADRTEAGAGPSVDAGVEPSSDVHVAARRQRSHRGHRPRALQMQPNVEDV